MAHIVAAGAVGPRGDKDVPEEDLVAFDNLILLCPNCHTIVDRAPEEFSTERLSQWKREHEDRVHTILQVRPFKSRTEAYGELQRLMSQNRAVWMMYGPESAAATQPESAAAWLREVADVIIPNNARISALFEVNAALLEADEHSAVGLFDAHRRGLEARHLGIDVGVASPRFPVSAETVFEPRSKSSETGEQLA